MKKIINNKGFSLVELLAVITIIGILSGVGVTAYSRYRDKTNNQAYKIMSENAAIAAEEYFMDYKYETTTSFKTLVDGGYFETPLNPVIKGATCGGSVKKIDESPTTGNNITITHFRVTVNCTVDLDDNAVSSTAFTSCYVYPEKTKCAIPD